MDGIIFYENVFQNLIILTVCVKRNNTKRMTILKYKQCFHVVEMSTQWKVKKYMLNYEIICYVLKICTRSKNLVFF